MKIYKILFTVLTSTQSTLSPALASQLGNLLDKLKVDLLSLKGDMLNFPGDPALIADQLKENSALSSLVTQLRNNLPVTTPEEVNDAIDSIQKLKQDFNAAVAKTQSN